MKYIILKEKDVLDLCDHYGLEYSIFQEYGGAILYEDGTLYPYNSYSFPCPVCDHPGLVEDYQYFLEHGYTPED